MLSNGHAEHWNTEAVIAAPKKADDLSDILSDRYGVRIEVKDIGQVRGIKRLGPKPKFEPIRVMSDDDKRPVAFFEDVHVKEGTTNDRLYSGRDPADDQRVHNPEAAGGRATGSGRGRAWTDEEDTQIIVMVKGNHTIQEIAEEIDRSWDATQKRITRLRKVYGLPYSTRKGRH